jgi:hypothetical protein
MTILKPLAPPPPLPPELESDAPEAGAPPEVVELGSLVVALVDTLATPGLEDPPPQPAASAAVASSATAAPAGATVRR